MRCPSGRVGPRRELGDVRVVLFVLALVRTTARQLWSRGGSDHPDHRAGRRDPQGRRSRRHDDDGWLVDRGDLAIVTHLQRGAVEHQHAVLARDVVVTSSSPGCASVQPMSIAWLRVHHVLLPLSCFSSGPRLVQFAVLRRARDAGWRVPCGGQLRSRIVLVVGHGPYRATSGK